MFLVLEIAVFELLVELEEGLADWNSLKEHDHFFLAPHHHLTHNYLNLCGGDPLLLC